MGISIPAYHLKASKDLPQMRRRLKGGARQRSIHTELTLTSMIDIMSVVILFLIQSFSATGEVVMINKDITLPQAYYGKTLTRAPIVTVTPELITLEGLQVGDNKDLEEKVEERDWDLPLLTAKLDSYKRFVQSIYPDAAFPGEVIVQADAGLSFIYLKRVMYALTKQGYSAIHLAVRGEAQSQVSPSVPTQEAKPDSPPGAR